MCREPDITNGHVAKCLASKIVSPDIGWAPPQVCIDTVVGSGLPKCCYCGQERPLHYPGDCDWALYDAARPPCLICGADSHVPEECVMAGTTVIGRETGRDMIDTYLTQYWNRGQCYICKAYHIDGRLYGDQHYTSKKCLHSLLSSGKVRWDRKESLLQRSKDHRRISNLPEPKRQRGPDGRPLLKKTPEQQYTIKILDKVFKQLKDQRSVPMVFQLTRYLARKGLDPISEGEAQALERYIQDNQRQQALEWVRARMIERRRAFEEADDELYGRTHRGEDDDPQDGGTRPSTSNASSSQ